MTIHMDEGGWLREVRLRVFVQARGTTIEAAVQLAHCAITLAGYVLQAFGIGNVNAPAAVADQAFALESSRRRRHRSASRSQHDRQKLLCQQKRVTFRA